MTGHGRRRVVGALAALTVAGALVAGCSPVTTARPYAPSDGVRAVVGTGLTVENLLILTESADDPALVVGALTNRTAETTAVTLTFNAGEQQTIQVPANGTVLLNPANPEGQALVLSASPAAPGAVVSVTIATAVDGSVTAEVPVLDGTLEPYGEYIDMIDDLATGDAAS